MKLTKRPADREAALAEAIEEVGLRKHDGGKCLHTYPRVFREETVADVDRLVVGIPDGNVEVFRKLAGSLEPPYYLLYVLHTTRSKEQEPGRYQSPPVERDGLEAFLMRFAAYLSHDARHDIWVHSPSEKATVVWDRHDLIYAYGPLERFKAELGKIGFTVGDPEIPFPHAHHYRQEYDSDAAALFTEYEWTFSPLQPEDEQ